MAFTTTIKTATNHLMRAANLKLETLTAEKFEASRIEALRRKGHFERPVYPVLPGMIHFSPGDIVASFQDHRGDLEILMSGDARPGLFDPHNAFFKSPDAEILYLMVRSLAPARILEVGSGNSTKIIRQAIVDGKLAVEHTAIDPQPRADIEGLVDKIHLTRFEDIEVDDLVGSLGSNDILFIDSSHEARVANDVAKLFCSVIPALAPGVVVHVHDIFLPFEYPEPFCTEVPGWGEQYLLQAMLQSGGRQILWPGYYVQKLRPEFHEKLPFLAKGRAQSFWFRV